MRRSLPNPSAELLSCDLPAETKTEKEPKIKPREVVAGHGHPPRSVYKRGQGCAWQPGASLPPPCTPLQPLRLNSGRTLSALRGATASPGGRRSASGAGAVTTGPDYPVLSQAKLPLTSPSSAGPAWAIPVPPSPGSGLRRRGRGLPRQRRPAGGKLLGMCRDLVLARNRGLSLKSQAFLLHPPELGTGGVRGVTGTAGSRGKVGLAWEGAVDFPRGPRQVSHRKSHNL